MTNKKLDTIEKLLRSRKKDFILYPELLKDLAKRIKKLEKKVLK